MKNTRIYFLMALSALFWGGAFIAGKLSAPFIPPFTLTFLRFSIASIILYGVILVKEKRIYKLKKEDIPVFLFTGIEGQAKFQKTYRYSPFLYRSTFDYYKWFYINSCKHHL
ncbi:DMT family transporter [Clostridium sp. ZS2-4]|uniref:DMT family transporter n=1 Tax=Clostridium sp. ZS2-4 TaxID=2987703 RepID=UPI00227BD91E|nr:DMT family transporter [Clostridium sp. ZS2-4]MCY6356224.1 DMT family transporter [Clostridium sp. ZS2-4]